MLLFTPTEDESLKKYQKKEKKKKKKKEAISHQ